MYIVNLAANTDIPVNSRLRHDVRIEETWREPGGSQIVCQKLPYKGASDTR